MERTEWDHTKQNKSGGRPIPHYFTPMWNTETAVLFFILGFPEFLKCTWFYSFKGKK